MAFLRFIYDGAKLPSQEWLDKPEHRYRTGTTAERARFVLEQSIALAYLEYLYGTKSTILLNEYRQYFLSWYYADLASESKNGSADPALKSAWMYSSILLKQVPGRIDAAEVIKLLKDDTIDVPIAVDKTFYEPFLKFKECVSDLTVYEESEQMSKVRSFSIGHACSIPTFKYSGKYIRVSYETTLPSYSFNYRNLKAIIADIGKVDTIWTFLAGYHWSGRTSTSIMGVLAAQCLIKDPMAIDRQSPMIGYLDIYQKVVCPEERSVFIDSPSAEILAQRRAVIKFLIYLRKTHRIVLDDAKMLANFMDAVDTEEGHPLRQYLLSENAGEISAEIYSAFRNSRIGKFEELDKFRKGYRNAAGGEGDAAAGQDSPDDSESPSGGSAPGSEGGDTEQSLKALESPTRSQDPTKDETTTDTTDSASTDTETGTEDAMQDNQEDQPPPLPRVSDKKGLKLKLSEGESPDTVLYREELKAYIDALLTNPPKSLSVQSVAAIRRIKANWLYLLDVECLHDFLSAIIRLPKSLNVKPPKKEEK